LLRHWLAALNIAVGAFVAGGVKAPVLAWSGLLPTVASALYVAYHLTCHQWAFRTFFLFGGQLLYGKEQLETLNLDPYGFVGAPGLGWKMAFCERDLAIYVAVLVAGIFFAARREQIGPLSIAAYGLLILPMAIDGFTQLFGWRESTWELRVLTGLLFGAASVWLLYPRFDASFGSAQRARRYAPENACAPQPPRG